MESISIGCVAIVVNTYKQIHLQVEMSYSIVTHYIYGIKLAIYYIMLPPFSMEELDKSNKDSRY